MSRAPQAGETLPLGVRRHRLVGEVARRLKTRCGVPVGSRIVVGVSGGPDSVALLLAVVALRGRRGRPLGEPLAVHVNHHLREAAGADESFVADLCARFEVPLEVRHVRPDQRPGNIAANARELRYEALAAVARSARYGYVAVAHQAEDQFETLLMALGRGAGLDGLSGMAWSRPLAPTVTLVRPLLRVRKADCEALCRAAGVEWRRDPTNLDPARVRGRLRRDVVGVFETLWPGVATRAGHTADIIAAARSALEHQVAQAFGAATIRGWERPRLATLPVPVIAAGLRRAAVAAAPDCSDDLGQAQLLAAAEAIADDQRRPRTFDWPGGMRLLVSAREVSLLVV